mmetsp:Transcript_31422/g.88150  ORF Transcript_31422/g.88150 Transcript_31422/m.88150 type:complete len:86 (-) Transcript_31422:67-324(-)
MDGDSVIGLTVMPALPLLRSSPKEMEVSARFGFSGAFSLLPLVVLSEDPRSRPSGPGDRDIREGGGGGRLVGVSKSSIQCGWQRN